MADGWRKNLEVLKDEWTNFGIDQRYNWSRLLSEPWSRKPHILVAFISTSYKTLPRTLTYITMLALAVWAAT